jgi:hypothetical protein
LVNDLQNNKSFEEKPDVKKSQHRNKNISNIEIKKKDKKYLEGIPLQPEAEINESEPTYYYYKRWVWLIFPWACINQKQSCNYSLKINQNNSS